MLIQRVYMLKDKAQCEGRFEYEFIEGNNIGHGQIQGLFQLTKCNRKAIKEYLLQILSLEI